MPRSASRPPVTEGEKREKTPWKYVLVRMRNDDGSGYNEHYHFKTSYVPEIVSIFLASDQRQHETRLSYTRRSCQLTGLFTNRRTQK